MSRYSLVSKNKISGTVTIHIKGRPISEIDKYVLSNFSCEDKLKKHYGLSCQDETKIRYQYDQCFRFLEIIYNNSETYMLKSIVDSVNGRYIDMRVDNYITYLTKLLNRINIDELNYLYDNCYINLYMYNILFTYLNDRYHWYSACYNSLIYNLKDYLSFRKLFIGDYNYRNKKVNEILGNSKNIGEDSPEKKRISTGNEFLNGLYNDSNGNLDEIYANFDLDELRHIEGSEQLGIDGICKKKVGKHN